MAREFSVEYLTYEVIESGRVKVIKCDKSATEIIIPENVEGYRVTTIASEAFESCEGLVSIIIPESVTYIGSLAFWNCNSLTSLTIPSSVNTIGDSAFYGCNSLTSVTCFSNNPPKIGNDTFYPKISVLYVPNTTKYIYIKYGWNECFKKIITEEEKQYLKEELERKRREEEIKLLDKRYKEIENSIPIERYRKRREQEDFEWKRKEEQERRYREEQERRYREEQERRHREEQERRHQEELERMRRLQKEYKEKLEREREEQERRYREEQERKQEEYLKSKCEFCIQLEKNCKSIGATIISKKEFSYDIFVPETADSDKMFLLFKSIVDFSFVIERTSWRILDKDSNLFVCNYYIIDIEGNKLVSFKKSLSVIQFLQEDIIKEFKKGNIIKQAEKYLYCYLENRKIKRLETEINNIIKDGVNNINALSPKGNSIGEKVCCILEQSKYSFDFKKSIDCYMENSMLIIDYELPNIDTFSNVKEYKFVASTTEINEKKYPNTYISQRYDNVLYSIVLRSIYEIYYFDKENNIESVTFNGYVSAINPSIGQIERKCIISIQIDKERFSRINLEMIEPKACFKSFKGVSAAKLIDISPITPILTFNKEDKRFIEGKHIDTTQGTNLAAMHWEDFEQLVRELFELEFSQNGGEVHVTQASRDGGVDAIVFDPDPLRGGKIVIQAKRYTNTVGVSAVRDLYGTVINEGANTGILITTSDYGYDSYEFAKDKPLKLLNGGHLLALLHKNGRKAHINIEEAKKIISENNSN